MRTIRVAGVLVSATVIVSCSPAAGPAIADVALIEQRLRAAALSVERAPDPIVQPFMRVPGTLLRVGDSDVQVFVYPDAAARGADTEQLDPVRVSPPTMSVLWRKQPGLIVLENVALIVLTNDEALRNRIRAAVTGS